MAATLEPNEGQFIISAGAFGDRFGFGSLSVETFKGVRTTRVLDEDDKFVGLLIGSPINVETNRMIRDEFRICTNGGVDAFVEREIFRLAGSFLFICEYENHRRIYLDANGTRSLVYDPSAKVAGATATAILDDAAYEARFDHKLHHALGVDRDGWFPAGLTAHKGIERLICNHYLDLDSWQAVRHWPCGPLVPVADTDANANLNVIAQTVRGVTKALAADGQVHVSLTAGNETRALLACYHGFEKDLNFFTVSALGGELDMAIAKKLSARHGLRHHILPYREATDDQVSAWLKRAGHCLTGANSRMHPTMEPFSGDYYIGGLGGEVGRGFLWLNAQPSDTITATDIVDRLKLPRVPLLLERIESWRAELAINDALLLLDIAYIELRMSSWAYAQAYTNPRVEAHHPLTSRRVFEAMVTLPTQLRRADGMIVSIIRDQWPELLDIPINKYGDWRDRFAKVQKIFRQPRRAFNKVRQIALQLRMRRG